MTSPTSDPRATGLRVVELVGDFLERLPGRPVWQPVPPALRERFETEPLPRTGSSVEEVLDAFAEQVAPYPFGNGHPRFFAWVNSPPQQLGVWASALAAAMNPSVAGGNHAAVHVEHQVVRWLAELLGMPAGTGGSLVSGGSAATLTALAVARHRGTARAGLDVRAAGLQGSPARFTVHVGEETHGCAQKAVELLGLGADCLRVAASDEAFRLRPDALAANLDADRRAGLVPLAVVATAGTVNTGAVDPLVEIGRVCAERGVWLHVDGAYGAPAVALDRRYAAERPGLATADSVGIDAHKWLYVPVDAGAVLFRDPGAARDAFSLVPPYLRTDGDPDGPAGPPWFSEHGLEQTRPFRALKVWMALKHVGVDGYRRLVAHDLEVAEGLARSVAGADDLELLAAGMSIVCFRWRPPGVSDPTALDEANRRLLGALQRGGAAFLAGTTVRGAFALRACVVDPATTAADCEALLDAVRAAAG